MANPYPSRNYTVVMSLPSLPLGYLTTKKAVVADIAAADDVKDRAAGWIEVQLKKEEEKREEGGVMVLKRQNMTRGRRSG